MQIWIQAVILSSHDSTIVMVIVTHMYILQVCQHYISLTLHYTIHVRDILFLELLLKGKVGKREGITGILNMEYPQWHCQNY